MKPTVTALCLASLMCAVSVAGYAARPTAKAGAVRPAGFLKALVPTTFGDWSEVREQAVQVVNPQTQQLIDTIYKDTLTRVYVNSQGYRIMLSMAYGDDQTGGLAAHKPEVCYPAQGFKLGAIEDTVVSTAFGDVAATRLATQLGVRNEPVTYWLTTGDRVVKTTLDKRIAQIRLGLTGQIPDGLLFRVSSIDPDNARGFEMQRKFSADLLGAVDPAARKQLSGLDPAAASGGRGAS